MILIEIVILLVIKDYSSPDFPTWVNDFPLASFLQQYIERCPRCKIDSGKTDQWKVWVGSGGAGTSVDALNHQLLFILHNMHTLGLNRRYLVAVNFHNFVT